MRWSLRRGEKGLGAKDAPAPPSPVPAAFPAEPVGHIDPPSTPARPAWTSLSPLTQSWSAQAPLTTPVHPSATRPITHRAPNATLDGRPEPGRVIGLASVVPPLAVEPPDHDAPTPSFYAAELPLRHASVRPLVEHAPLTEAVDAYVGEPVAPAPVVPPPPAPSFFPSSAPRPEAAVRPAATDAGTAFQQALANLANSGHSRYEPGGAEQPGPTPAPTATPGSSPAGLQPPVHRPPQVDPNEERTRETPPLTHRRNTLAQSRRLGLGAPIPAVPEPGESAAPQPVEVLPASAIEAPPEQAPPPPPEVVQPAPIERPADRPLVEPSAASMPLPPAAPVAAEQTQVQSSTMRGQHRRDDDTDDRDGRGGSAQGRPAPPVRPITDPTVRPTLRATPLIYRATPRPQLPPAETRVIERAVVTRAPQDLVRALSASHGIDVRTVEVRRDTAVGAEASSRGARAFTRGSTVHLPESAGSLTTTATRALLAHELVHAAQQRRLGGALPGEHTPEGRALEAEARAAERSYGGSPELTSEEPLRHAPPTVSANWVDDRITQHAAGLEYPQPHEPIRFNDPQQIDEIKFAAQQVIMGAMEAGTLGGSGAGGGAAGQDGSQGVGIGQAQNEADFDKQVLAAINIQRRHQGLADVGSISELSRGDQELIHRQWSAADAALDQQRMQTELRHELGLPPAGQTGTPSTAARPGGAPATPAAALPGAPVVLPDHVANAALAGMTTSTSAAALLAGATAGAAAGAAAAAAAVPGTDSGAIAAAATAATPTAPATVPAITAPRGPRGPQGVGIGGAQTREEFDAQLLMAINLEQGPSGRQYSSISELPRADRDLIDQQWTAQYAIFQQEKARFTLTHAMQQQVVDRQAAASGAAAPTAAAPATTPAAGVAPAAVGTTAAGHVNLRPSGHPETPIDALDLTELAVRIYDRLRSQMRTELLVDRERAGLLTDFR